jgi:hypothetical protein
MSNATSKSSTTTNRRHSRHHFSIAPSRWTRRHITAMRIRYSALYSPPDQPLPSVLLDALLCNSTGPRDDLDIHSISKYSHRLSGSTSTAFASYNNFDDRPEDAFQFIDYLFHYVITSEPSLRWTWGAGGMGGTSYTIRHGNKEARWRPTGTGFWRDTIIPKVVVLEREKKTQPKWAYETACVLSMAQIAVTQKWVQWTPVVLSVTGTTAAMVTANVDKKYLSQVEAFPYKPLDMQLDVQKKSWDLTEKLERVAFVKAVWRALKST